MSIYKYKDIVGKELTEKYYNMFDIHGPIEQILTTDGHIYDLNLEDEYESMTIFYDSERNVFMDEGGYIVYNIYDYVTPNQLFIFREKQDDMFFKNYSDRMESMVYVELIYPEYIPY